MNRKRSIVLTTTLFCLGLLLTNPAWGGLTLWLDASDPTTILDGAGTAANAGGFNPNDIATWNDKSGQGNHATQVTPDDRPSWVWSGQNSEDILRWTQVEHMFFGPLSSSTTGTYPGMTAFIVVKSTGDGTFLDTFDAWLSNTDNSGHFINDRPIEPNWDDGTAFGTGGVEGRATGEGGVFHIITAKYDFSTGDITTLYNGDPNSYTGCSPGTPPCNHMGATITFDQVARYFDGSNPGIDGEGDLAEIRLYDEHLSAAAEDAVGFALGQKWGIQTDYTGDFISPTVQEWSVDGSGDWNAPPSNWDTRTVPDGNDHTAIFGAGIMTSGQTVFTNTAVTVNQVQFNNTLPYAIAGLGSINFVATTADPSVPPAIDVQSGSHQFQAIVNLLDSTTVDVASGSTLEFNNRLFLNGNTHTKTGDGTLVVSNTLNTGGGTLDCQAGTCSGSGNIAGDLNNTGGTVAPGNSPGILTIDGNYTQGAGGTLALEIGGATPGEEHDKLVVNGAADINGNVTVELTGGFDPPASSTFDVLDFSSFSGTPSFDFSLAPLSGGLTWDISQFNTDGVLCAGSCDPTGNTDFDDSGFWDLPDLNLVLFNWQQPEASLPPEWVHQQPATVGLESLNLVLFNWQQPSLLATVPEPLSLVSLLTGVALLCARRQQWRNDLAG